MNHEKVKSVVFDILESCDCKDERVCDKCPFVKLCVGIFTGDWSNIPQPKQDMVNEDEGEKKIFVNLNKIEKLAKMIIFNNMNYLAIDLIEAIVRKIRPYYEEIDGKLAENYKIDDAIDWVYTAFDKCFNLRSFTDRFINSIVHILVNAFDKTCILIE